MKYEKDRKIFGIDEYLIIKFLKKYALPLIAGLLVLIILISDMPKRLRKNKESATCVLGSLSIPSGHRPPPPPAPLPALGDM